MVNEHEKLFKSIEQHLSSIKDHNNQDLLFSLNYIEEEIYSAIEIRLFERNFLTETFISYKILDKIRKNDIVSDIYIMDKYKTFVIHIIPLSEIRNNKIKKLKNRLELIT